VLDSDVLVHALRRPKSKELHALHEKAARLFESCTELVQELVGDFASRCLNAIAHPACAGVVIGIMEDTL
jgi:hypothetical protein